MVGLLLFAVFYPTLTGASAHDTFDQVILYVIVIMAVMTPIAVVIGARDIYRRYIKRKPSPTQNAGRINVDTEDVVHEAHA